MTIQGAMNELINLLKADDIPIYYKGGIKKVIETIDDYIDGKDDYVKRKTENSSEKPNNCEPQYEMSMGTLRCDNCSEYGSFKCTKCDGEMYFTRLEPKTEPNNYEPKICDTCRYYNSNIPCGSTPSACKEADKFAEEFVDGLKKLKPKDEPRCSVNGRPYDCGYCEYHKCTADEPQTERLEQFRVGLEYHTDTTHFGKTKGESITTNKVKDEPQTDCAWGKDG